MRKYVCTNRMQNKVQILDSKHMNCKTKKTRVTYVRILLLRDSILHYHPISHTTDSSLLNILPSTKLNRDNYINHLGTSSVLLDPLYFGAGNSFHESMVYGTPTVTLPTKFIKSRIVSAAYIQMEIENPPIVKNKNEYIELATEIANKKNLLDIKKYYQIKAREKLFNTFEAGEEFNKILLNLN